MNKQTFDNPFCKFNVLFSRRLFSKVFVLHLMTKSYFCNVFLDLRSALLLEHFILLFLDFSLTDWASQVGAELAGNLPGKFVKILLQHLGLDVKLNNPPCDSNSEKYSPAQHGWKSGEYLFSHFNL